MKANFVGLGKKLSKDVLGISVERTLLPKAIQTSWCCGHYYCTTSFEQSLESDSAQVQTLLAAC